MRDKICTEICLKFFEKLYQNHCKRNKCLIKYKKFLYTKLEIIKILIYSKKIVLSDRQFSLNMI